MGPETVQIKATDVFEQGRSIRKASPRSAHGDWAPPPDRPDPVAIIEDQNTTRVPWLIPLRRGRMSASPFAFFRGSAAIMASDLARTPSAGLVVQLCGDAHLSNFGIYGSPERNLVFDLNDFDETLPGPFEWDVKRLAASFTIAAQHRGWDGDLQRRLAESATRSYRLAMRVFAGTGWLETWYDHVDEQDLVEWVESRGASKAQVGRLRKGAEKARSKDHLQAAEKLVEQTDGRYRFRSAPPVLVPLREVPEAQSVENVEQVVEETFQQYRSSLNERTRTLLDRYRLIDVAMKVVGVGSVGTRCWVTLLLGRQPGDVLLLQVKQAVSSVLEGHLPASRYERHGQRVVEGQRLMQASSDIFLGWSGGVADRADYYWRQLKDWKGSLDLDKVTPAGLEDYAEVCGYTMARAHAVSGDPAAIAGYLGGGDVFDAAIGEFAVRYARQNDSDYRAFQEAIAAGLDVESEDGR